MTPNALYLCYQSLLEPLTQTQVVAYLEGLSRAGHGIHLLTFEPTTLSDDETRGWRERLALKGIVWHTRRYHKRPTLPATAFDVLVGILTGLRLIRRHGIGLVHARSHVPGMMGLWLKRLTGVKLLFDVRGLMAEEYVDAGIWTAGGFLFRATKRAERALMKSCDGVVVLSHPARELLAEWYPTALVDKPIEVIPCCVDLINLPVLAANRGNGPILVYAGKLGGWYLTEEMVAFVAQAAEMFPGLRWQVWTQSDPAPLRTLLVAYGLEARTTIGRTSPESLKMEISTAHVGLSLIKPCVSKKASSPTKVAEYLAAGLSVICTEGIGDTDEILTASPIGGGHNTNSPVGVLVREFTKDAYRRAALNVMTQLDDPDTPRRCRAVAEKHFDLQRVGWVRYRRIYEKLIGRPDESLQRNRVERPIEPISS